MDGIAACWTAVQEHRAVPDDWFPGTGRLTQRNRAAMQICGGCPIRKDCLKWALRQSQVPNYGLYGIWAGSSPEQRRRFARSAA